MNSNDLGARFRGGEVHASELQPSHVTTIWVIATVVFGLLPYGLLMFIYHAISGNGWPSAYYLFGRGDLGTAVIAITAATVTEIIVGTSLLGLGWRAILGLTSVVSSIVAITLFTLAEYQSLSNRPPDYGVNAVTLTTLLLLVVIVHLALIVRGPRRGADNV